MSITEISSICIKDITPVVQYTIIRLTVNMCELLHQQIFLVYVDLKAR